MNISSPLARSAPPLRLVICGGGAAAILVLQALKQHARRPVDVTVLEPRARLGTGVAYSTDSPIHLLNTRACNMSVTDQPDDFVNWLRAERPRRILNWTREDFAPRSFFADYLQARLAELRNESNIRLTWLHSSADSVNTLDSGWEVVPAHGAPVIADVVVLATGNEPPRVLGGHLVPSVQRLIVEDPWDAEQKAEIPRKEAVLLAGTSLTSVDVINDLLQRGHTGPIIAVSRRGLLPRSHGPIAAAPEGFVHALPASLRDVVRYVRELSVNDPRGERWRRIFTELRSIAPSLWRGWSVAEKKRFLRHVRPFWDVHRHRVAPRVHARIERAIATGRLIIVKGRVLHIEALGTDGLRVSIRQGRGVQTLDVARVINCTGPEQNPGRANNPLLQGLLGDRLARPDALGLGLAVDSDSRVVAANGSAHSSLYALGALTRGAAWEVTAIPELKEQVNAVVRRLALVHGQQVEHATHESGSSGEFAPAIPGQWGTTPVFQPSI
jgi:uncharacterized NAD(P)/FAD-binding protein YdhS